MLHQGRVLVMEDQLLQRAVQVVGLCETVACVSLVDDAMLHVAVHTGEGQENERELDYDIQYCFTQPKTD